MVCGVFFLLLMKIGYNEDMEMHDEKNWQTLCPETDCRKKNCRCGLEYVFVPSALTDEAAPEKGKYCNAIVEYEETGAVYIYSKEGIPVLVKEGNAS